MTGHSFLGASLFALLSTAIFASPLAAQTPPPLTVQASTPAGGPKIPATLPLSFDNSDPTGVITTYQPNGPTITKGNPYFTPLGANGRTCFTCHQPNNGWGLSGGWIRMRFNKNPTTDPLFLPVDGAVCPSDPVATPAAAQQAYRLLLSQGLIRVGLAMPANAQFTVAVKSDPDNCTGTPATGLTSPSSGTVNVYRRPLQTANLTFLSAIMWDGREPSLAHQAIDAALTHEQAATAPSATQQKQIVAFESGLFAAQSSDTDAGDLTAAGGGPVALSKTLFTAGINDSVGQNPTGAPFNPAIFSLYNAWSGLTGTDAESQARASIARGQQIFNTKPITITTVAGLNDLPGKRTILGTCGTGHDTPNVGNRSLPLFLNMGIAATAPPGLNATQLPVFALTCSAGAPAGAPNPVLVTDPGRALTTGSCADIGKFKVPELRGLASRAPYFHNGGAGTLNDVLTFYQKRFNIPFTAQERTDLINFLQAL